MQTRLSQVLLVLVFVFAAANAAAAVHGAGLSTVLAEPHLLFTSSDRMGGVLGAAQYGPVAGDHVLTPFACQQVDYAGGRGVCLKTTTSKSRPYTGFVFDRDLHFAGRFVLSGNPLAVRVRADGLVAAYTVGAYTDRDEVTGPPSLTRVFFVDLVNLQAMPLDSFSLVGQPRHARGTLLFSHVSFDPAHLNRFYAAMAVGADRYLVRGDYTRRTLSIVRRGGVLPAVSPDGEHVAFVTLAKHPRLSVLDLATGRTHSIAETRDVEDQPAWLDAQRLVYPIESKHGDDLWAARADGHGRPSIFLRNAVSPSVVIETRATP